MNLRPGEQIDEELKSGKAEVRSKSNAGGPADLAQRLADVEDELLAAAAAQTFAGLSRMERAILVGAARGDEDKEIAALLGCSVSTVRTLWRRIHQKAGQVSRRSLVALVWKEALRLLAASFAEGEGPSALRGYSVSLSRRLAGPKTRVS